MGRSKRRIETVLFEGESSNANVTDIPGQEAGEETEKEGKTMLREVHELPAHRRIPVVLNEWGQPVGDNAKPLANWIGVTVRANCPLNYVNWHKVPTGTKTLLKNLIKRKFDLPAVITVWMKKTMAKRFRDVKSEVKASYFCDSDSEDVNLENFPPDVQPNQWHYLVSYWKSTEGKNAAKRNKKSRSCQVTSHTTGSKSFARVEDELNTVAGRKVGKIKVLEDTHTRKNGTFIDESVSTLLEKAKATIHELSEEPSYMEELEILSTAMRAQKNGVVRGMGLGPTPTTVLKHIIYMGSTQSEECASLKKEVAEQRALICQQHETLDKEGKIIKSLDDKMSLLMQHIMGTAQ